MMSNISRFSAGITLLRLGLSAVFLWFGFSQLFDSLNWVYLVPNWAVNILGVPPAMIVLANGAFEVVLAGLLAMGFFVRIISLILAIHLIPIAFGLGLSASAVRDFGIIISTLSLSLMYKRQTNTLEYL